MRRGALLFTTVTLFLALSTGVALAATLFGTDATDYLDGTRGDDVLLARSGGDIVLGMRGDDVLSGGAGGDSVSGDGGKDALYGGSGGDQSSRTTACATRSLAAAAPTPSSQTPSTM